MIAMHRRAALPILLLLATACSKKEKDVSVPPASTSPAATAPAVRWGNPKNFDKRKDENGNQITVVVEPAENIFVVDVKAPPSADMPIGRFTNVGSSGVKKGNEKMYNFEPDDKASYVLYILNKLDPKTKTTAWEFRRVGKSDNVESHHSGGGLIDCEKYHPPMPGDVGFKACPRNAQTLIKHASLFEPGPLRVLFTRAMSLIRPQADSAYARPTSDTDPAWISCSDGCCTLSAS